MRESLVERFHRTRDAPTAWAHEVAPRAEEFYPAVTRGYFLHMSPPYKPNPAMQHVVGRREAAYNALAPLKLRPVPETAPEITAAVTITSISDC